MRILDKLLLGVLEIKGTEPTHRHSCEENVEALIHGAVIELGT